jgi:hypothetical protein
MNHDIINFLKNIDIPVGSHHLERMPILQSYFTENSYSSIKDDMDPFENQLVLIILYANQDNNGIVE